MHSSHVSEYNLPGPWPWSHYRRMPTTVTNTNTTQPNNHLPPWSHNVITLNQWWTATFKHYCHYNNISNICIGSLPKDKLFFFPSIKLYDILCPVVQCHTPGRGVNSKLPIINQLTAVRLLLKHRIRIA